MSTENQQTQETQNTELNLETVQKFLQENEDGKKYLKSNLDSYAGKAIKTFEENFLKEKLPKLLDDEISKRYPAETPEQKRLKELELKFTQAESEKKRAQLQSMLLKKASEKQLPDFLVDYAIDEDEEKSVTKLYELGNKYVEHVNKEVEHRLTGKGRQSPINPENTIENITLESLKGLKFEDIMKNKDKIEELMKRANSRQ